MGAVVFLDQLVGINADKPFGSHTMALALAFCTATSMYLLDRVKVRDRRLDPADALSHPDRYAYLSRHPTRVRELALALLITATWAAARFQPRAAIAPPLAAGGVFVRRVAAA